MAENEQKPNAPKKQSTLKITKLERDAKEMCIGIKSKRPENVNICKLCRESGALLYCSHCTLAYHLSCAKMKEADVPISNWFCIKCTQTMEKKLKEESAKHEKNERLVRTGKVKELFTLLSTFEKDKIISKFGKKYPQFVKQGKITYPIEDSLLLLDPDFHQVVLSPLPKPIPFNYPNESFLDVIAITVFVYSFSSHINVSPFSVYTLYAELTQSSESQLIKEIIMALIKELTVYILSKDNIDEQLSGQNRFLYSAYKLSSVFDIITYIPYSWLTLLSEIMTSNTFKEYVEETPIENILQKIEEWPLENSFFSFSLMEKVSCINFLISCFFDTKVFHEALSERIDQRTNLSREKALLKVQIKELEQKQTVDLKALSVTRKATSITDKISKLQNKISDISHKIEEILVRVPPIGQDRDHNEYYLFKFDYTKLYMLKPLENTWHYFNSKKEIEDLIQSLCSKGIRENKLLENLKSKLPHIQFADEPLESPEDYNNRLSEFRNLEGDLSSCKKLLLDIEKKFSKYLNRSDKQWDVEELQEKWKNLVICSESVPELSALLLEHYEKSSTPLRQTITDSNSENSEEVEYERKYRKVSIRIWQDFGDHNVMWEELVSVVNNPQQLILAIGIYAAVLDHYIKKKSENMRAEEKRKPKDEKKKKENRVKTNKIKHEDNCFFCEDGGELICCEGCSRVVHPECIGFDKVPDEDWFCDTCAKQGTRVTRSRTRLRKLNADYY